MPPIDLMKQAFQPSFNILMPIVKLYSFIGCQPQYHQLVPFIQLPLRYQLTQSSQTSGYLFILRTIALLQLPLDLYGKRRTSARCSNCKQQIASAHCSRRYKRAPLVIIGCADQNPHTFAIRRNRLVHIAVIRCCKKEPCSLRILRPVFAHLQTKPAS
ncbi:hypothetical protein D3C78_1513250 [compost metagenome]